MWNTKIEESNLDNNSYQQSTNNPTTNGPIKGKEEILFVFPIISWENVILENEKELIDLFYKLKEKNPIDAVKSNDGGWQSNNVQELPAMISLIKAVEFAMFSHFQAGGVMRDIWVNISGKGHSNNIHNHYYSSTFPKSVSGVYYFSVPDDNSILYFYKPGEHNFRKPYKPKPRDLIIFPTDVFHSVNPNTTDQDRISVAFNFDSYASDPKYQL